MRIMFLHLSDLHIRKDEHIEIVKIEKLVDSLNIVGDFDEMIIICSGDLASTGDENEYKKVKIFLGKLISEIVGKLANDKFYNLILVPGNHDANFNNVKRDSSEIQHYYNNREIFKHINDEIEMFKSFYTFAEQKKCFKFNKICDRKFLKFGDYTIQINMINSALFSTLTPDDKELHYFPEESLSCLKKAKDANTAITIMHHNTEWFNSISKKNLERVIYSDSSILFLGHEHDLSTKDLNVNNKSDIFISAGGAFNSKDIVGESEFNALLLDTETCCIDSYAFQWNKDAAMYSANKLFEKKCIKIKTDDLIPNKVYIDCIKEDDKRKVTKDFTNYFVFPTLIGRKNDRYEDKIEISDTKNFIEELKERQYIIIIGGGNSGKTTILKSLYLSLADQKVPLFFSNEDITGKKINKVIKSVFEDQYSEDKVQYEKFQQLHKTHKVAIVDDYDMIKNNAIKAEFLELLKMNFGYIIVASKNEDEFNIEKNVREEIAGKDVFFKLKISNFYLRKRQDLIKNVCKISKSMNDECAEKTVNAINELIKHQFQLFELNPDFIIQFTQYFLQSPDLFHTKNEAIFNKIFETNIYNAIIDYARKDNIEETITALEEIAYFIHFNKKDPLPLEDLIEVVKNYNDNYSVSLNPKELLDVSCRAKILKQTDDSFSVRFVNKNHLAFFVARCLNRRFNIEGSLKDIETVLNNICFGINDNIVLFISYLTSNPNVIMKIYEAAENLTQDWEEFDIDSGNIEFLSKVKSDPEVKAPAPDEKEKNDLIEDRIEEEVKSNQIIECKSIYDYDESKIDSYRFKLLRALKYTEMLAKALPSFNSFLLKQNKYKILDGIYRYPNKIIMRFLKPIDTDFKQLVEDIVELAYSKDAKNENGQPINEEDVEVMLYNSAISMMLNLYNDYAYLATDKKSIEMLNNYSLSNSNYKIFNLMIIENYGATDEFSTKAEKLFGNTKDNNIKKMIRMIVKKHLIYTVGINFAKRQQLVDKYFGKKERKNFLINNFKENRV